MIHGRLVFYTVKLGCRSLFLYKMRSSLTILGVIFGVGSVIAMLAIGEGASQAAEDLIRSLGSRNVILNSVKPAAEENNNQSHSCGIRYGLQYMDLHRMHQSIPHIKQIIPLRLLPKEAHFAQKTISVTVYSTLPVYQEVRRLSLRKGRFLSDIDQENASNVCVISETLARALFAYRDPLEQSIKIDRFYYKVVGILKSAQREMTDKVASATYLAVYIPLSTGKARFGETLIRRVSGSISMETVELHRVIVQCDDIAHVEGYSSCNRKIVATHP